MREALKEVVLAISTYQADASVLRLLNQVFEQGEEPPFRAVVVVDSLSSGRLAQRIQECGWAVTYENASRNLGSAGNLARRLEIAKDYDADWCYAINHDGELNFPCIRELVRAASAESRVGAVYPRRRQSLRGGRWEKPQTTMLPLPMSLTSNTSEISGEVSWSSSNGALYSLDPIREGLNVWADLWMGWEDLGYGWLLRRHGWKQIVCRTAEFKDNYEYRRVGVLGKTLHISDKPSWYAYYQARNLILVSRRNNRGVWGMFFVTLRIAQESVITMLFRTERAHRFGLLWRGFVDGLRNRAGKGPVPS